MVMAVRRVRRVIRKIDPWTVLKVSLIFNAIAGLMFVLGVWVMWSLAVQRGIPDRITEFFANFALVFNAEGELYFRVVVLLTIITAIVMTGLMTLAAVMYNLISDVVGGVEVIVLEETYAIAAARQAPLRPAVHMPVASDEETVEDASVVPITATAEDEEDEEFVAPWQEEPAAAETEDVEEEEDITVEDDVLASEDDGTSFAAASEG
jgi:Transmembrane domain of unknown function (DUF3566)